MLMVTIGLGCIALGVAGIRYAPAIVAAQSQQGMAPLEDADELEETDRIRVTKGTSVVLVGVGAALLAYGAGVV